MSRPIHFELCARDPKKIADFYRDVVGWESAGWDGPEQYWMITTGPTEAPGINGGIMHRHFDQPVINTVQVDSLVETLRRVEEAGGKKVHGPNEIPGVGTHVYCEDPEGTLFGILQPAPSAAQG